MPKIEDLTIADRAIQLILDAEGFSSRVEYPGGESGPTWGFGYDGAYHTAQEIRSDWGKYLANETVTRLIAAVGQPGAEKAKAVVERLKDIRIPRAAADAVFRKVDVPRWCRRAAEAFPGYEGLSDEVQGALVSLTFNRGSGMGVHGRPSWDSRREMRAIRYLIAGWRTATPAQRQKILQGIAAELRSMKRLWEGKGLDGLITRRENEARLVESAVVS
jgi:hypothetical protein